MVQLNVNGKLLQADVAPDTPLLWVLRDALDLTRTKFGCGMALCGACGTRRGAADAFVRDPRRDTRGQTHHDHRGHSGTRVGRAFQDAWVALDVPQCGYCQSSQVIAAAALIAAKPQPATPTSTPR